MRSQTKTRLQRTIICSFAALGFTTVITQPYAHAQAQNWGNVTARTHAENLHSKALNFLAVATSSNKTAALDQAITVLLDATAADPTDPVPLATLGLALDMKGRYQEALDALNKAYQLAPSNNETVLAIALTHYLAHNYAKGIDALNHLLQHDPNLSIAYGYAGYCYMRLGEFDKADDAFHHLAAAQPGSQLGYHGLALNNLLAGDLVKARANAEHALSINKYPPTMLILAEIDALEGFGSGAKSFTDQYNRATHKFLSQRPMTNIGFTKSHDFHWDPFLSETYDNGYLIMARTLELPKQAGRQRSLSHQGHGDVKVGQAQQALAQNENDYFVYNEIGKMQTSAGNYDEAESALKKVLELAPKCHVALFEIADAYAFQGKNAEAAGAIVEFHQIHPDVTVPEWLVSIAKSIPADKLPPQLVAPPAEKPGQQQPGESSSPSGF